MPTQAVLVTWRNMENRVLPEFIAKAQAKYGGAFQRLYFDGDVRGPLAAWVAAAPAVDRLKIFISGHGGTGMDFITDDTQARRKTVDDLVDLLTDALMPRHTARATSASCQVNMLSCLFGRSPDGLATNTPAARLHEGLADWDVFVDLVARTESIVCLPGGRHTQSELGHAVYEPVYGRQARFLLPKAAYTKVLHTYHAGARVIRYAAYDGADTYVEASTLDGRRLLWADFVVDRLVRVIRLRRTGTFGTGPLAVTDAREQVLERIVSVYDALRNAALLKQRLEALVDGTGDPDDATQNFLKHRNPLTALVADEAPKKARLIRELLAVYPV